MLSFSQAAGSGETKSPKEAQFPELSFEELVKNKTLPPCSLNDFMDYLVYIENKAENLQFFLWYCDYVERWSKLLPRQKLLSPTWDLEKADQSDPASPQPRPKPRGTIHRRTESDKLAKILAILEETSQDVVDEPVTTGRHTRKASSASVAVPESPCCVETRHDWQPYTIQPFRDEMTRVVRHYIAESSPRQLDLFPQEREACLRAVQHTTHPSALLPAFLAVEATLKTQLHPNFKDWSLQNANRTRLAFFQFIAILIIVAGFVIDILLILSNLNRWVRLICIGFWWPGLTVLIAAVRGTCVLLYSKNLRVLRPWEQFPHTILPTTSSTNDTSSIASFEMADQLERGASRVRQSGESLSRLDPLRKPSLQAFGPANDASAEGWAAEYKRLSFFHKVFAPTMLTQNTNLRELQDRLVLRAVAWAGLFSIVLTVASVPVPGAGLF